jgi:cytochrome c1
MPTQIDALSRNISLEKLQQGRRLYMNTCTSSHNLHLPSEFTKKYWEPLLNKMQKRAKINDAQKEQIAAYLETNSKKQTFILSLQ